MKMNKNRTAAMLVTLAIVGTVTSRVLSRTEGTEVEIERVQLRTLTPSILASGTLIYESQVMLVPEVIGRVKEVLVKEGDIVAKGQLLLRLDAQASLADAAQLRASRQQAALQIERQQVNHDYLASRVKRYTNLRERGLVEATKYDELVSQAQLAELDLRTSREAVKQADAQLRQSMERLAKTEILAPIDGKITSIAIKPGETAVPSAVSIAGSNLMTVSDTSSQFAEVNVDEADVARVAVGQLAKIVPAAFPDKSLSGRVDQVAMAPRQNPGQSRTYAVRVRLDPKQGLPFHPGMSCRAEIATIESGPARNLAMPVQAVQYEEADGKSDKTKAYVFVNDDGKATLRHVETGISDDSHIEILSGLKAGEQVLTGPSKTLRFLKDGDVVHEKRPMVPPASASVASEG